MKKNKEMITEYQSILNSYGNSEVIIDESKLINLKKRGCGFGTFEVLYHNDKYTCNLDQFKIRDYGLFTPKYRFDYLIFNNEELKQYFIIKYEKVVLYVKTEFDIPFGFKWINPSNIQFIKDEKDNGILFIKLEDGTAYEFKNENRSSNYHWMLTSKDNLLYTIISFDELFEKEYLYIKQQTESQIPLRDKILESLNKNNNETTNRG